MRRAIVGGIVAVLLFDTLASWASAATGFAYTNVAPGSWLIYAAVGYVAARQRDLLAAVAAGAIVGLVDASAGWALSWAIGPGRLPGLVLTPTRWIQVALIVVVTAAGMAVIGGLVARFTRTRVSPTA